MKTNRISHFVAIGLLMCVFGHGCVPTSTNTNNGGSSSSSSGSRPSSSSSGSGSGGGAGGNSTSGLGNGSAPASPAFPDPGHGQTNVLLQKDALGEKSIIPMAWLAPATATRYVVQISRDSSFPTSTTESWGTPSNHLTFLITSSQYRFSTKYYWRVTAHNGYGATVSPVWSFTTESRPGPPPLTADAEPNVTLNVESGVCPKLKAVANGGTPPYRYVWSAPGWPGSSELEPIVCPTQTTVYTLTVRDSSSPTLAATDTLKIEVRLPVQATESLSPMQSAFVSDLSPDLISTRGNATLLRTADGRDAPNGSGCIIYLQFDLTPFSGTSIVAADLIMTLYGESSMQGDDSLRTSISRPSQSWQQGTLSWSSFWEAGGHGIRGNYYYSHSESRPGQKLTWDLTQTGFHSGRHLVQGWVDYPDENTGLMVIAQGPSHTQPCGDNTTCVISEHGSFRAFSRITNAPLLRITYRRDE